MGPHKYSTLIIELENSEYDGTNTDIASLYMQLFALYLYENNLINAQYLWMRIPDDFKMCHKEFAKLFQLMQSMQGSNSLGFFQIINFVWPDIIKVVMKDLQEKKRAHLFHLVAKVYSHIYEQRIKDIAQLTSVQLQEKCEAMGWVIDKIGDNIFVVPERNSRENKEDYGRSENQLFTLTGFVSLLEN